MRVLVDADVFNGAAEHAEVVRLLQFSWERRHRILVTDRVACQRWCSSNLSGPLCECYENGLDWSEAEEARNPSRHELRAGIDDLPRVLERLGRPFVLVLENDQSDRAFLEAIAPREFRDRLQEMIRRAWIQINARGGVEHILGILRDKLRDTPGEPERFFALFDSDALDPGRPDKNRKELAESCASLGVQHHVLRRRAIENYLTRAALERWTRDARNGDRQCSALLEALYSDWFNEVPERRHHFDMKRGREGGARHSEALYQGIPEALRRAVAKGFSRSVAGAFAGEAITERDLRDEGAWDELSALLRDVMECAQ